MNNHYNPNLKLNARQLRTQSVSRAEKYLWKNLLSRKQLGVRFLRQRPMFNFIVDFFAPEIGLIIEIDGSSHTMKSEYDAYRQNKLETFGYTMVRFKEGDVINNIGEIEHQLIHIIHSLETQRTTNKSH